MNVNWFVTATGAVNYFSKELYSEMVGLGFTEDEISEFCLELTQAIIKDKGFIEANMSEIMTRWLNQKGVVRMNKVERHLEICQKLNTTYALKNRAYGDSFGETFRDLGVISAVTRINDKFNRLKTLIRNTEIPQGDESIADTLLDMANYCIMTYMELENDVNDKD